MKEGAVLKEESSLSISDKIYSLEEEFELISSLMKKKEEEKYETVL